MKALLSRLLRLEGSVRTAVVSLREMVLADRPVIEGSPEHLAALANPLRGDITAVLRPDEPIPDNPIL